VIVPPAVGPTALWVYDGVDASRMIEDLIQQTAGLRSHLVDVSARIEEARAATGRAEQLARSYERAQALAREYADTLLNEARARARALLRATTSPD
jgi:metal-dependent amidase/aminoacylase/carboxypeptidase family protein